MQFVATLISNIEVLTGSPVNVTITSFKEGSVVATIETDFQDNNATSAATYAEVMKSGDVSQVFGTSYGAVTVDPNSVQTGQVSNPAGKPLHLATLLRKALASQCKPSDMLDSSFTCHVMLVFSTAAWLDAYRACSTVAA